MHNSSLYISINFISSTSRKKYFSNASGLDWKYLIKKSEGIIKRMYVQMVKYEISPIVPFDVSPYMIFDIGGKVACYMLHVI